MKFHPSKDVLHRKKKHTVLFECSILTGRTRHCTAIYHNNQDWEWRADDVCDAPTPKQETFDNLG